MLIGLDPILDPDLLFTLRAMGHGDEIVIADANYPGMATARANGARLLRADGVSASRMLRAILSVMPLDSFVSHAAHTMQVVDDPDAVPPAVAEFRALIAQLQPLPVTPAALERFAFYDRARRAFAVVQTGETRLYGNIILTKGVVTPDAHG